MINSVFHRGTKKKSGGATTQKPRQPKVRNTLIHMEFDALLAT